MRILGIETSCDETGVAVIEAEPGDKKVRLLSNIVASSLVLHTKTGGVIPEVAAREQIKYIIPVIEKALRLSVFGSRFSDISKSVKQVAGLKNRKTEKQVNQNLTTDNRKLTTDNPSIDAIAVTVGPGLVSSLLVGTEVAKTLAYVWNKPLIPVNHLIGHIYANWMLTTNKKQLTTNKLEVRSKKLDVDFPALALVVSGGHTDLVLMKSHGQLTWLGGTRDDAAGEAFDKIGRLLNLDYPGGPAIAAEAAKLKIKDKKLKMFPRAMINEDNFDFSFSGLKTAVLREVDRLKVIKQLNNLTIQQLAFETQQAIVDVLVVKTVRAAKKFKVKSILLGGGVAANNLLRKELEVGCQQLGVKFFAPAKNLCTDNAAMIAAAAFFNYQPVPWRRIKVNPNLHF